MRLSALAAARLTLSTGEKLIVRETPSRAADTLGALAGAWFERLDSEPLVFVTSAHVVMVEASGVTFEMADE